MNTLQDFWEKLRCCTKVRFTYPQIETLKSLVEHAQVQDIEHLRYITLRFIKGFVFVAEENEDLKYRIAEFITSKEKEPMKTSSDLPAAESET